MPSKITQLVTVRLPNDVADFYKNLSIRRVLEDIMPSLKANSAPIFTVQDLKQFQKKGLSHKKNDNKQYYGHFVYKYVYKDDIIYIGKTDTSLTRRLSQHGKKGDNIPESAFDEINASAIYYCELLSSKQCDIYESELIRRYKPKYNKAKTSSWDGVDLPEPNWTLFKMSFDILQREYNNLLDENKQLHTDYDMLNDKYIELLKENFILKNGGKTDER